MEDVWGYLKTAWSWLPTIGAAFGGIAVGIYNVVQLYESRTFQHWKANFLIKRRAKKLARLKAREKIVLAQIEALEKIRTARAEARELVAEASAEAAKMVNCENTNASVAKIVEESKPLK